VCLRMELVVGGLKIEFIRTHSEPFNSAARLEGGEEIEADGDKKDAGDSPDD